jgi:hypothetical protein
MYFASFIIPMILISLPFPAAERHPHSMMQPPPRPPDVTLGIQAKEFDLGFIRPENLVSEGLNTYVNKVFLFLFLMNLRTKNACFCLVILGYCV